MSERDQWGAGEAAKTEKAFQTVPVGEDVAELFFGEHPHSRSDNNIYARFPNGEVESFSGHRILWGINLQEHNYLKESGLSGNDVRMGGTGLILCNGKQVFEFFFRGIEWALNEARKIIADLEDCPVGVWDEKAMTELPGRKVYYRNHPAKVKYFHDRGCVTLVADPAPFPTPPWRKDDEDDLDDDQNNSVLVEITSKDIWWWRK